MSARRSRPVLYEVARHARPATSPAPRPAPTTPSSPREPDAAQHAPVEQPPYYDPDAPTGLAPLIPTVRADGARIFVTMGWPAAVIVPVIVLVLLFLAFSLGRSTAIAPSPAGDDRTLDSILGSPSDANGVQPAPADSIDVSRIATPPRPPPEGSPRESARAASPSDMQPSDAKVEALDARPGAQYVVIQYFPAKALAAALKARDYLRQGAVPCVLTQAGRDYVLIATEPFDVKDGRSVNRAEQQRATALIQRIKDLGKAYIRNGYSFDQASLREPPH